MAQKRLKVGVTEHAPFVFKKDGKYMGFDIELWEMIANVIGVEFEYITRPFKELLPLTANKQVDIATTAITINEEREKLVDFSHPTFDAGLKILLPKERMKLDLGSTLRTFFTQGYKQIFKPLGILAIIVILFAHIIWFIEGTKGSFASTYFPGIFQSLWFSLTMILGSPGGIGVYEVRTWAGRAILEFSFLIKLMVLGLLIGELTAFITTRKVRLNIESAADLKDQKVATVKGTTSEKALRNYHTEVLSVLTIEEAFEKLRNNNVVAVVFDAPILEYYTVNEDGQWAEVVGDLFEKQNYGIALPHNSQLREPINRAILAIKENGSYDILYNKWFGKQNEQHKH